MSPLLHFSVQSWWTPFYSKDTRIKKCLKIIENFWPEGRICVLRFGGLYWKIFPLTQFTFLKILVRDQLLTTFWKNRALKLIDWLVSLFLEEIGHIVCLKEFFAHAKVSGALIDRWLREQEEDRRLFVGCRAKDTPLLTLSPLVVHYVHWMPVVGHEENT